jgi:hypothetical protein
VTEPLPGSPQAPPRPLRFVADASANWDRERVVVLDPTWTPGPSDPRISVREPAERLLAARDLFDEASRLLNDWAERSDIVEILTIDGTSFWYQVRLGHWWWLQERLVWLGIIRDLVGAERPSSIRCSASNQALTAAARLVARAEDIGLEVEEAPPASEPASDPPPTRTAPRSGLGGWLDRRRATRERAERERRIRQHADRLEEMERRVERAAVGPRPLVVLMDHPRQVVETARGRRELNPYIDPILEELGGAGVRRFEIETRARVDDEAAWRRAAQAADGDLFLGEAMRTFAQPQDREHAATRAAERTNRLRAIDTPLVSDGVDLGPDLVARLVDYGERIFAARFVNIAQIGRLLERVKPMALLLADEYHRQEWLAPARRLGIPVVAIQHGSIQRRHLGYVHDVRPPQLTLPDRTYVFGNWEKRLLVDDSVYRPDEVVVSGSPRLDIVSPTPGKNRTGMRRKLGVRNQDTLVVISTTWGDLLRRFHFPVSLARLVDRPLPGVHLVIKLHPTEPDDGLYRRVIEDAARARGYAPPRITVIQKVDLYELLSAADAHLGLYSTVITEAVFTATPNLLAACVKPNDLLGYVEAGVAVPVRDGGELLALLQEPRALIDKDRQTAFVRDHFEPGNASRRIRDDLLGWLQPDQRE